MFLVVVPRDWKRGRRVRTIMTQGGESTHDLNILEAQELSRELPRMHIGLPGLHAFELRSFVASSEI